MSFAFRSLFIMAALALVTVAASAQDLGSANKLFGGGAKSSAAKKAPTTKKPAAHAAVTKKKPATIAARPKRHTEKPEAKATVSKPREIVTVTGTKITKPAAAAVTEKKTTAKTTTVKKLSPADEERYADLIEQGNAARDDREYAKAESAYKSARAINARDARAIYGLGNLYNDQQRWEEAENSYRAALEIDPSDTRTLIALSYVLSQPLPVADLSDRYAEAEKLARQATATSPRSAFAFDQLGVAMEMRGQIGDETEAAYRKAIALDPAFASAYAHLGRVLRRRGLNEQSKDAYEQAVERSTDVATMVLVADVLQSEQRFAESIPLLKQALAGDPRNPSALLMMGRALTVKAEYKDAEATLQRAVVVSSNGYMANSLLASLYSRQGAYELAENALLQAIRTAPAYEHRQLAQGFITVAQGYTKTGKDQQAKRAYAKAAELDSDSGLLSGRFRQ